MTTTTALNYSRLTRYLDCPKWYDFEYAQGLVPARESDPLLRGRAFHAFAADYITHCRQAGLGTDITRTDTIAEAALSRLKTPPHLHEEVYDLARKFTETHVIPTDGETFVEEEFGGEIGEQHFTGHPDMIHLDADRRIQVTDWKTDHQIRSQGDVDRDFQLSIYGLLVWLAFDRPPEVEVALDFVRHGVVRKSVRTAEQLERTAERLLGLSQEIAGTEIFEPRIGEACSWCPWTQECPAFREALERGVATAASPENAVQLAEQLLALETRAEEIKGLLKPWASKHGPVALPGLEVGFRKSASLRWKADDLVRVLRQHGLTLLDYLQADTTKVKKLLGSANGLGEDIREIAVDASTTRFGLHKVKEVGE